MLSTLSRVLLVITALLYAVLGLILFLEPRGTYNNFAWIMSPLVSMTIGGWCLGNAWSAWIAFRRGLPAAIGPVLYIAVFGVLQVLVVAAFWTAVLYREPLAQLYLAALAVNLTFASSFAIDWLRGWLGGRPLARQAGAPFRPIETALTITFIALVGFLGFYGLTAKQGMPGLNRGIFPEPMSMFTLRSFGAFYLALALAAAPLLVARGRDNLLTHGFAQYPLIVFITVAAVMFIDRFDFANRPTQVIYLGIYVLVGGVVGIYLLRYGTGRGPDARQKGGARPARSASTRPS